MNEPTSLAVPMNSAFLVELRARQRAPMDENISLDDLPLSLYSG